MFNWRHRRLLRQAWHPTDEELLLYVDGEADARGARRLTDHLAGCWTCRSRRAEIERAIGAYVAYHRDPARAPAGGDAEQATRRFADALARGVEPGQFAPLPPATPSPAVSSPKRPWWMATMWRDHGALVRVVVVFLALSGLRWWWTTPASVSARELFERVDRAQAEEISTVANPVIYQRLQATRSDVVPGESSSTARAAAGTTATVTWEVWASQHHQRRVAERGANASPLLLDLQAMLRANGMEPGQPLSRLSLTAGRKFAGHVSEDVRESKLPDGTRLITLTSSAPGAVAAGRIARSEVIVRKRDLHPVGHVLTVATASGGQQRYTITELSFRVVPLATVDPALFADTPNAPAITRAEPAVETPAPRASTPLSPALERAAAAVQAQYARHTSGACLDAPGTATQHLFAVRELAEWYRTLEDDGVRQGLDGKPASLLASMIRDHLNGARERLPVSGEAIEAPPQPTTSDEPWTTVAMKAYAAVEYASRSGEPDAAARARGLVDALDRAARQLSPGSPGMTRPVTPPQDRP